MAVEGELYSKENVALSTKGYVTDKNDMTTP